jgi:hypothetical protein
VNPWHFRGLHPWAEPKSWILRIYVLAQRGLLYSTSMTETEQTTTSVSPGNAQTAPSLNQEVTFQSSPHKISDNLVIERGMVTVRRATLCPTADTATENSGHELNYKIQTPGLPDHTRLAGVPRRTYAARVS